MQDYVNKIIQRGLDNGVSIEEMMSDPKKAAQAYLKSQMKALDKIEADFKENGPKMF